MDIKLPSLTCLRCNHTWIPRQTDVRICPDCKSSRWDTPRAAVSGAILSGSAIVGGFVSGAFTVSPHVSGGCISGGIV